LKKIGYDGAKFFIGGSPEKSFRLVGKHCTDIGLEVTAVTVMGPHNPISSDANIRMAASEQLKFYRPCCGSECPSSSFY